MPIARLTLRCWPSVIFCLVFPGLCGLGFWQLERAEQKRAYLKIQDLRRAAPPLVLGDEVLINATPEDFDIDSMFMRRALARGRFDPERQILLDNQVQNGRVGYHVYTLFKLNPQSASTPKHGDVWILVNRGWVPLGLDRSALPELPVAASLSELKGVMRPAPTLGIYLADGSLEIMAAGISRAQVIDLTYLADLWQLRLVPLILRLERDSPQGFQRDWPPDVPRMGPDRHNAYALQWFALALVFAVMFFWAAREE